MLPSPASRRQAAGAGRQLHTQPLASLEHPLPASTTLLDLLQLAQLAAAASAAAIIGAGCHPAQVLGGDHTAPPHVVVVVIAAAAWEALRQPPVSAPGLPPAGHDLVAASVAQQRACTRQPLRLPSRISACDLARHLAVAPVVGLGQPRRAASAALCGVTWRLDTLSTPRRPRVRRCGARRHPYGR